MHYLQIYKHFSPSLMSLCKSNSRAPYRVGCCVRGTVWFLGSNLHDTAMITTTIVNALFSAILRLMASVSLLAYISILDVFVFTTFTLLFIGLWLAARPLESASDFLHDLYDWFARFRERREVRRSFRMVDRMRRKGVGRKARKLMKLLESGAIERILDDSPDTGFDPILSLSIKWSRKARINFQYPAYSRANEIIAADWINKQLTKAEVRPSHIERALPLAIKLTFVKSADERDANDMFDDYLRDYVDEAAH